MAASWEELGGFAQDELAAWDAGIRERALAHLRRPQTWPQSWRMLACLLVLLLHTLGVILLRRAMLPAPMLPQSAVEVRLLAQNPEPPLPEPAHDVRKVRPRPLTVLPRTPTTPMTTQSAVSTPAQELHLFNVDGSVHLPSDKPYVAAPEEQGRELRSRGHNIVHCRQTRFAQGYQREETVGEGISRKYLKWIGLYNAAYVEAKAAQREAERAAACDD